VNRRSLPVAAALTATAALLLTACGSGDDDPKANDKIAGADQGNEESGTPSPTAKEESAGRPTMPLPNDVKEQFDGWKTGDPTKDEVLADAARAQTAVTYSVTQGNADEPALGFYQDRDALIGSAQWVQEITNAGLTFTGTVRYYAPKIELFDKKSAGVVYCSDESKAFNKNRKTGEVDKTPATTRSYVLYSTRLDKNAQGIWQTTNLTSKRGDKSCTP
jgi:hypothetical protein